MPRVGLGLRSRKLYYGALLAILLIGAALTIAAVPLDGIAQDVLMNLGTSVIGVFLVAVVLEPIIERAAGARSRSTARSRTGGSSKGWPVARGGCGSWAPGRT